MSPLRRRPGWRALWLAALLVSPVPALAQLALTTMADTQYEYNSNVFALQNGTRTPFGGTKFGDSDLSYGGELDASYLWSQQLFYATILGNEYRYNRFQELNHSDDSLIGGWDWKVGRIWDGIIDVEHIRSMVSFWNTIGTSLVIQTEQRETARASVQATPDWRAEFTGLTHKIDQPQVGAPDLSVTESSGTVGVKYTGTAGLTAGVDGSYLKGSFHDTGPNLEPGYSQESGGLTATDEVTGLSTFRGQIGYTRRSSDSGVHTVITPTTGGNSVTTVATGGNSISAVTGDLDYKRNLTGKTKIEVDLSRQINIYVATSTSEIDSIATLSANWQATYKINVLLGYTFTYRQLPDQGNAFVVGNGVVPNGTTQTQRLHSPTLTITYDPFPWLVLKPYFNYQTRASENFVGGDFNSTLVGLRFTLQWEHGVVAPRTPIYNYN
jgi:hypothetical protein